MSYKNTSNKLRIVQIVMAILAMAVSALAFLPQAVFAGTLTHSTVLELGGASGVTPMIAATGQSFAIDFTTATAGATSVAINFAPAGSSWVANSGSVNATQTVNSTLSGANCTTLFSGATDLPGGSLTAAGASNTVTISSVTALGTSTNYCTFLTSTSAVTNPSAGVYPVSITAGSDSQTDSIDILSSGANAIAVSGTVQPTFTMSLGGNTDALGNLSSTSVTTSAGVTTTVKTNAASGWFVWAEDSSAGLHSTQQSHTIASVTAGSAYAFGSNTGAENYGIAVTPISGSTAATAYVATTNHGSGLANGTYNEIAYSTSPTSSSTFTTNEIANISATTPAATDYTDTVTLIGAGSF